MSDYERTKMYEDIIARLEQQNADLVEENLAAHLVNKELADEVRGLRQDIERLNVIAQNLNKIGLAKGKLAEERRVALERLAEERQCWCYACGAAMGNIIGGIRHKPNCDYVRLCKKD
jgi:heme oxygenase